MQGSMGFFEDLSGTVANADVQGGVVFEETTINTDVLQGSGLGAQDSESSESGGLEPVRFRPWDWGTYRGYLRGLLGGEPGVFLLPLK